MLDRDVTPKPGNWIEVALAGVKNLKTATGSKVEVMAGAAYAKQTYSGVPLVFRLGSQSEVETVRIVTQPFPRYAAGMKREEAVA